MSASLQELRDRVKASGQLPGYEQMTVYGLSVAVVAIVMPDLQGKVRYMLGEPAYSPADIESIASALLIVEERVNKALERAGKDT